MFFLYNKGFRYGKGHRYENIDHLKEKQKAYTAIYIKLNKTKQPSLFLITQNNLQPGKQEGHSPWILCSLSL